MDLRYKYRGSVQRLWPQRLLDTATMTSYERLDGNVYDGVREPKYSIVSYTWGRWALRPEQQQGQGDASRVIIKGITWEIPRVDPRHFSAHDFERMLSKIHSTTGNRFVWIDVACIDHDDPHVQQMELGRTPGFFANASAAFIWLCTVPSAALEKSWECWRRVLRSQYDDEGALPADQNTMAALKEAVLTFLGDPYFSSLWTTQEQGLRRDAFVLSREGNTPGTDMMPCNFHSLQLGFSIASAALSKISRDLESSDTARQQCMRGYKFPQNHAETMETIHYLGEFIQRAGFTRPVGTNPNLYYTTTHRRMTVRRNDRVYGVMGLYGIQVGAFAREDADPGREYTLLELEQEFAVALIAQSLFLAQLFVHVERPAPGATWKITHNARVPEGFDDWTPKHVTDDCVLDVQVGRRGAPARAHIRANVTSFESLVEFWKVRIQSLPYGERRDELLVVVDDYICQAEPAIPYCDFRELASRGESGVFLHTQETVRGLLATFESPRLSVLKLGGLSLRPGLSAQCFGLLILHDQGDQSRCQRIGLCRWEGDDYLENRNIPDEAKAIMPRFEHRYNGLIS